MKYCCLVSFLNLVKQLRNCKLKKLTGRFVSGLSRELFFNFSSLPTSFSHVNCFSFYKQ